jgi:hypothetical protein
MVKVAATGYADDISFVNDSMDAAVANINEVIVPFLEMHGMKMVVGAGMSCKR